MSRLTNVEFMLELIKEHGFTAYEIAKGTNLSTFGIQKIINGETKRPSSSTLEKIFAFIEEKSVGAAVKGHKNYNPKVEGVINMVAEPIEKYNEPDIYKEHYELMKKYALLDIENNRLKDILDKHKIKY